MKQKIITIATCGIFFFILRWYSVSLCLPQTFLVKSDPVFSSSTQSSFVDQLMLFTQTKKSLQDTISSFRKIFPYIKNIAINYRPTNCVVHIQSHTPLCIINDAYVLIDNGVIFEKSLFEASKIVQLPSIFLAPDSMTELLPFISQRIHSMPHIVYTMHKIIINNKNDIRFIDKKNDTFAIVCSFDQYIPPHLLDQCEMVKKNLMVHGLLDKGAVWIADTRFANYIVAYKA